MTVDEASELAEYICYLDRVLGKMVWDNVHYKYSNGKRKYSKQYKKDIIFKYDLCRKVYCNYILKTSKMNGIGETFGYNIYKNVKWSNSDSIKARLNIK